MLSLQFNRYEWPNFDTYTFCCLYFCLINWRKILHRKENRERCESSIVEWKCLICLRFVNYCNQHGINFFWLVSVRKLEKNYDDNCNNNRIRHPELNIVHLLSIPYVAQTISVIDATRCNRFMPQRKRKQMNVNFKNETGLHYLWNFNCFAYHVQFEWTMEWYYSLLLSLLCFSSPFFRMQIFEFARCFLVWNALKFVWFSWGRNFVTQFNYFTKW